MNKQYAVLGLGIFGTSVAIDLQKLGCEVIAVDNHMEQIEEIADSVSYAMKADVADPEVIRSLGARNLDGVIVAVADNMEASIMATLVSKEMGVPYVLAKAKNELHGKVLKKVGADAVIFPEQEMGKRIARHLTTVNFTDWITLSSEFSIVEIPIPEKWIGKSLQEMDVRQIHNVNVIGMKEGERVEVNLDPKEPLRKGVHLILMGSNQALKKICP